MPAVLDLVPTRTALLKLVHGSILLVAGSSPTPNHEKAGQCVEQSDLAKQGCGFATVAADAFGADPMVRCQKCTENGRFKSQPNPIFPKFVNLGSHSKSDTILPSMVKCGVFFEFIQLAWPMQIEKFC